jgi:ribonuclease HI
MIRVAIDGSSLGNPGPTGWAWYIDDSCWAAGGWSRGTNNKGELYALLAILEATQDCEEPLQILCDSRYVIDSCTKWMTSWKKRGWRTADNKPIKNPEEMKALDVALAGRNYSFEWVRGHTGNPLNEKADDLARAAATAYQDGTPVARGPGFRPSSGRTVQQAPQDSEEETATSGEPVQPITQVGDDAPVEQYPPDSLLAFAPPPHGEPHKSASVDPGLSVDLIELTRELISDEALLDRDRLGELLHPEYVAHLPEGIIRTKGSILARPATLLGTVHLDVYGSDRLAEDVVVLRYRMKQNSQDFLCAVVWQHTGGSWEARFHTVIPIT